MCNKIDLVVKTLKESKIVLFGAGKGAQGVIDWLNENSIFHNIEVIIDNDKKKHYTTYINSGVNILPIEELHEYYDNKTVVIITVKKYEAIIDIRNLLISYGIEKDRILVFEEVLDCYASIFIEEVRKRKVHSIIRVGFVTYEIETWDKLEPVYADMVRDERFEPIIFVLPQYDHLKNQVSESVDITLYEKKYVDSDNIIPYYKNNGEEINVEEYDLDYIFLSDPYDYYIPDQFKSYNLVKYVRICYLPYGFNSAYNFVELNFNRTFFRNISIDFTPEKEVQEAIKEQLCTQEKEMIHQYYNVGYPSLERYYKLGKRDGNNILWTPRWTCDPKLGGSHFFEYKDSIHMLKDYYGRNNITIRPHPLMFDNFVNGGMMTIKEVSDYKKMLRDKDIIIDEKNDLFLSLSDTDILISDFSSILLPFFLTERPIIYCVAPDIKPLKTFELIMSGMYLAYNCDDIKKYIKMLNNKDDPLFELRRTIKKKIQNLAIGSTDKIKNVIYEDYI